MHEPKRRRQFGLKAILLVTLVIGAYAAGYAQRGGEILALKREIKTVNEKYVVLQGQIDWYDEKFGYPVPSMIILPSGEEAGPMRHPIAPKNAD